MNYLKTSLIGVSALAVVFIGAASAHAQVFTSGSSITAIGSAGSQVIYLPTASLTASQIAISQNAVPANYRPGYYNYPGNAVASSTVIAYSGYPYTMYPGVPNTGGTVSTTGNGYTSSNPSVGTYIAPMTSYGGAGITGGVSIPVGYTAALGMNGSILTTSNWSTTPTNTWNTSVYPGVPNTGGTVMGSAIVNNGTVRVNGIVTIITPTAIGLSSGGQTWTIGWNSNTVVSTANGNANISGGQLSVGDMVEVDGMIDSTFMSKINATAIRDLSFH